MIGIIIISICIIAGLYISLNKIGYEYIKENKKVAFQMRLKLWPFKKEIDIWHPMNFNNDKEG